ncbi:MAG: MATE family efflux transporter [Eubacterium sp.]|nr:MATE family efflux transporter [Eubacterium sp.]MBR1675207.1 MATE family efflux transporter [Eubacterium sp.]
MLVQALYNVVDSIFVAQVSKDALAAVTYAFPMQNLMIAVGSGTGVGINALLSRSLGEKRFDRSNAAANNGLLLTLINALVFLAIGLFGAGPFIRSQVSNPQIVEYGTTYLSICSCFSFGIFFQMTFERLLQSTGLTIYSMISQGTGAVINIIFDPILIFGYFGFPKLGVAGAAYATVLGQIVAATIGMILNLKFNKEIQFSIKGIFTPVGDVIKRIYIVGVPSILMMSIGSVMTYMMNQILSTFSTIATTVFGAYFKLQSFFFMPIFGLNNGLIPVLAYNYGARKKERIREALGFAMKLAVSIMLVGLVSFQIVPKILLGFFKPDDEMLRIGVPALRIISLSFPMAGACIAMGSVFQAFSKSIYSLVVSIGRQLVALIPAAWLLSKTGVVTNVWWAFLIAEGVSLILSLFFFRKVHRDIIDKL